MTIVCFIECVTVSLRGKSYYYNNKIVGKKDEDRILEYIIFLSNRRYWKCLGLLETNKKSVEMTRNKGKKMYSVQISWRSDIMTPIPSNQ